MNNLYAYMVFCLLRSELFLHVSNFCVLLVLHCIDFHPDKRVNKANINFHPKKESTRQMMHVKIQFLGSWKRDPKKYGELVTCVGYNVYLIMFTDQCNLTQ